MLHLTEEVYAPAHIVIQRLKMYINVLIIFQRKKNHKIKPNYKFNFHIDIRRHNGVQVEYQSITFLTLLILCKKKLEKMEIISIL